MVLRRNNSSKFWAARVCDSSHVFFTFFFKLFDGGGAGVGVDKEPLSEDWFLFDWAKNISTIDLVVDANFSNSLLHYLLRFSMLDKPHSLTPHKYPPVLFFQTGLKMRSSSSNYTPLLLSPNPFCVLSPFSLSTSKLSSSVFCLSRLHLSNLDLSELDSDQRSLCSSQKLSSSLYFIKNCFFCWLSTLIIWAFFLLVACAIIRVKYSFHFLLSPITRKWLPGIQLLRKVKIYTC